MLNIREEQMTAFAEAEMKKFTGRAVSHLARCFPRESETMGELGLLETVEYGLQRSSSYGIVAESDILKYLDMMVVFGRDYDADERFAWAGEILQTHNSPKVRMSVLTATAKKYLN